MDDKAVITTINSFNGEERVLRIDIYLRDRQRIYVTIARTFCTKLGKSVSRYLDEIVGIVRVTEYKLIERARNEPEWFDTIKNWTGFLKSACRNEVRSFFETGAGSSGITGVSSHARRVKELNKTAALLRTALNHEPTREEILDETNRRIRATRKDPEREGLVCTSDDFNPIGETTQLHDYTHAQTPEDDYLVHSTEWPALITECVDRATRRSEELGQIADAYYADAFGDGFTGAVRHPKDIASTVGVSYARVVEALAEIQAISREVVRDFLGDTPHDLGRGPDVAQPHD